MFRETKCDGIMVGRGAQGNPWIFKSILQGSDYKPTIAEIKSVIFTHIDYAFAYEGEKTANLKLRKHIAWYIKGLDGSSKIRDMINKAESIYDVKRILNSYFEKINEISGEYNDN